MAKIYTIAGFLIALSIGLVCVSNIIHDRMKFRDEAVRNVETTWGKAQTIGVGELEYKEKIKKILIHILMIQLLQQQRLMPKLN